MAAVREALAKLARNAPGGLVSVSRAADCLDVSAHAAAIRLAHLERAGWVTRVRRGLYLIRPLESEPKAAAAIEDAWILARELFAPCYVGGWSAAEHWGLTEQLFQPTFVVSAAARRRKHERFLATDFHVVRVGLERLRGAVPVWRGAERVLASNRERTVVDALIDPSWIGGVRHLTEVIVAYRASEHFESKKLLAVMNDIGNGAAFKRLGYIVEKVAPEERALVETAFGRRSAGTIRLDPAVVARGRLNKRWGLWLNVSVGGEA